MMLILVVSKNENENKNKTKSNIQRFCTRRRTTISLRLNLKHMQHPFTQAYMHTHVHAYIGTGSSRDGDSSRARLQYRRVLGAVEQRWGEVDPAWVGG